MTEIISGLVTTIIPVFNRSALLREAVASVLAQTYRPIEVIIVDDGSTDNTPVVGSSLASDHPDEVIFIQISNGGPGAAREAGRKIVRGEFIQYLDSDDLLLPEKFEMQVNGLREHPECGVSYGKTRYYGLDEKPTNNAWKRTGEHIDKMFPAFLMSRWWGTSTPLYRRIVIDAAGPWAMLKNEEDWEYDCRIASQCVKLHFCEEFVSEQRDHDNARLSRNGSSDPTKLADRSIAHTLILRHAKKAGISLDSPEMQHFARELFLLSRQCGAAGLVTESKGLFELARQASLPKIRNGFQFRAYQLSSSLLGWKVAGKLSAQLDKLRTGSV